MKAHLGRLPLLQVKIGSFGFDDDVEKLIDQDALMSYFGHAAILKGLAGDADDFLRSWPMEDVISSTFARMKFFDLESIS
jgi:hypothetical protein